jgi:two-component system, OmpR family, sensor kinase
MTRRLTIAILILVAATLVVVRLGSYFFVRRATVSTAQQELVGQARAISTTISNGTFPTTVSFNRELRIIRRAGDFNGLQVVKLHPGGTMTGRLPAGITPEMLNIPALQQGNQTAGHDLHLLVYTAVPTPIAGVTDYTPVLVITRQAPNPINGLRYYLFIGAIALVVAALVALALARRFTEPLKAAADTTGRIAAGDLDATLAPTPHYPEFTELATSINSMGATLGRARDQERQFLLSVSHELRTPLTSIRGYADAIVDGAAPDAVAAAGVIAGESRRLERLVQDLLDLARLDADRFSLQLGPVDCLDVARRVAHGFQPRADEAGVGLEVAPLDDAPLWVRADPDRLGQILANLVENAFSFAADRVVVGAGPVGGVPAAWVVDDGPGIAGHELGRVFERHFTSDRSAGRRRGSGLGLAIVSELAAAMGGTVTAESPVADGRGTRMVVWLQADPGPPAPPSPPGTPGRSAAAAAGAVPIGPLPPLPSPPAG